MGMMLALAEDVTPAETQVGWAHLTALVVAGALALLVHNVVCRYRPDARPKPRTVQPSKDVRPLHQDHGSWATSADPAMLEPYGEGDTGEEDESSDLKAWVTKMRPTMGYNAMVKEAATKFGKSPSTVKRFIRNLGKQEW